MSDFLNVFVDLISFRSGGKIFQKYDPEKDKLDLKRSIRGSGNIRFLHSVISLTECIGIVRVGKYRVVCLCVCVCVYVCLCVCLSVGARTPKLLGRFQ